MDFESVRNLSLNPLTGYWYRGLNLRHYDSRLSTEHSRSSASRFSLGSGRKPYRTLYLSENHQVASFEIGAMFGTPENLVTDTRNSWLLLSLDLKLYRIVDLCEESQQHLLQTNRQELTGNWLNSSGEAPTQSLGNALYNAKRIEGFLCPSAKTDGKNLVIFPDRLDSKSTIIFNNMHKRKTEQLR